MKNITNTFSIVIRLITYTDFIIGCSLGYSSITYNEIQVIFLFDKIIIVLCKSEFP